MYARVIRLAVTEMPGSGTAAELLHAAGIDADAIVGHPKLGDFDLGKPHPTENLRQAYTGFCKEQGLRPVNGQYFGAACTQVASSSSGISPRSA